MRIATAFVFAVMKELQRWRAAVHDRAGPQRSILIRSEFCKTKSLIDIVTGRFGHA
jgi:hypothetical protein